MTQTLPLTTQLAVRRASIGLAVAIAGVRDSLSAEAAIAAECALAAWTAVTDEVDPGSPQI